jgi:DNA polymerase-3 subunit alpha
VKPLKTRKGDRMATFVLEDMDSRIEIVAFPESYGKYYEFIQKELLVWVKASVQSNGGSIRVQLSQIMPLEDAFQKMAKKLILRVNLPALERSVFDEIKALLMEFEGECPVLLELETKDALKVLLQSVDIQGVKCAREMTERLEDLLGDNAVLIKY